MNKTTKSQITSLFSEPMKANDGRVVICIFAMAALCYMYDRTINSDKTVSFKANKSGIDFQMKKE